MQVISKSRTKDSSKELSLLAVSGFSSWVLFLNTLLFIPTTTSIPAARWKWIMAKPPVISTSPVSVTKVSLHLLQPGWNGTRILRSVFEMPRVETAGCAYAFGEAHRRSAKW